MAAGTYIEPRASYHLESGHICFSRRATAIRTVVGSCVAVCMWDRNRKCGGMNHFMYPVTREPSKATPQYGNVATVALVKLLEEAGCERGDLVAQILGGGWPEGEAARDLGMENVEVARKVLARKGIAVISEDVGGSMGRKVLFDTGTGELAVLKVHKIRDGDWMQGHLEEH